MESTIWESAGLIAEGFSELGSVVASIDRLTVRVEELVDELIELRLGRDPGHPSDAAAEAPPEARAAAHGGE